MWSKIRRYNTEIPKYLNTKQISRKVKNVGKVDNSDHVSINSLWYRDEKGYIVRSQNDK